MNQNNLIAILGLLLILLVICKYKNKSVSELFQDTISVGMSSLDSSNSQTGNVATSSSGNQILFVYADWCGHCQAFKPEWNKFEKICKEGGNTCRAINGDENPDLAKKYNIEGYPTILKCDKNGNKIEEYGGQRSADALVEFLDK